MFGWLFKGLTLKSFAAGTGFAIAASSFGRPVLVRLVKTGMGVTSVVADAVHSASAEASRIKNEAAQERAIGGDLTTEIQKLREEIAALRASGKPKVAVS